MKHFLVALMALTLVACAPARSLDPFQERKPDPIKDQGAHNAPVEWWYLNGHLETASGPKGFAAAIFQVLLPPNTKVGGISAQSLIPGPLFFGHYSVIDKTTGRFDIAERSSLPNAAPEIASAGSATRERLDVKLGAWQIVRGDDGAYSTKLTLKDGSLLDATLTPERPEVIHGPGWSGSLETGRMYYYSATRLRVTGTLNGQPVTGIAWFDHQWGGGDGDGSSSLSPRWDWFSLQLNDGRDMMVYRVKNAKGGIADEYVSITSGNGQATSSRVFKLRPLSTWKSGTGAEYPVVWVLTLENGERFDISAVSNNQEVRSEATAGFAYYEGAVKVTGAATGVGYMELTGYAPVVSNPFAALSR